MEIDPSRLRALRKRAGLTQPQLAAKTEVAQETLSRLENGKVRGQNAGMQERLAFALGTTVAYLCGRSDTDDLGDASAPTGPTVVRDPDAQAHPPAERLTPLVKALFEVMDPAAFEPADFDATRAALESTFTSMAEGYDPKQVASAWLVAARQLRREGKDATPAALATRVATSKDPRVQREHAEATAARTAEVRAIAEEAGFRPEAAAEYEAQVAKIKPKMRPEE